MGYIGKFYTKAFTKVWHQLFWLVSIEVDDKGCAFIWAINILYIIHQQINLLWMKEYIWIKLKATSLWNIKDKINTCQHNYGYLQKYERQENHSSNTNWGYTHAVQSRSKSQVRSEKDAVISQVIMFWALGLITPRCSKTSWLIFTRKIY